MDKLQQAKEAVLNGIAGRLLTSAKMDDIVALAKVYEILCQAELSAKVLQAQVDGGCFKVPHCLPPDDDDFAEEIG